jgi:hypothetical protein
VVPRNTARSLPIALVTIGEEATPSDDAVTPVVTPATNPPSDVLPVSELTADPVSEPASTDKVEKSPLSLLEEELLTRALGRLAAADISKFNLFNNVEKVVPCMEDAPVPNKLVAPAVEIGLEPDNNELMLNVPEAGFFLSNKLVLTGSEINVVVVEFLGLLVFVKIPLSDGEIVAANDFNDVSNVAVVD